MAEANITAVWHFETALNPGTGVSKPGHADRIIDRAPDGAPILRGDRIKGAVRHTAERLCRWYSKFPSELDDRSQPQHPALKRIFSCSDGARYRFAEAKGDRKSAAFRQAATQLTDGVAKTNSLRLMENWQSGLTFAIRIQADAANWDEGSEQFSDLIVLCAATLMTDTLGGKRSSGLGAVRTLDFHCDQLAGALDDRVESLIDHIRKV